MFILYRIAFHSVSESYAVQCEEIFCDNGEHDLKNIQR